MIWTKWFRIEILNNQLNEMIYFRMNLMPTCINITFSKWVEVRSYGVGRIIYGQTGCYARGGGGSVLYFSV